MNIREMKQALFVAFEGRVAGIRHKLEEAARLETQARALRADAESDRQALERDFQISLNGVLGPAAAPGTVRAPGRSRPRPRPGRILTAAAPSGTASTGFGAAIVHALTQLGSPATKRDLADYLRQHNLMAGHAFGVINIVVARMVRANKLREKDGRYTLTE